MARHVAAYHLLRRREILDYEAGEVAEDARPRKRRREDGRNEPVPRQRDSTRNAGRSGSQPRPDVQEGRPTTAPTRAAEAQARACHAGALRRRSQRAEHEPRGLARHLAPRRVQRRGGLRKASPRALRGWRGATAPSRGAARTVTPPAARFLRYSERRVSAARYTGAGRGSARFNRGFCFRSRF
jgi:hypothetical protein